MVAIKAFSSRNLKSSIIERTTLVHNFFFTIIISLNQWCHNYLPIVVLARMLIWEKLPYSIKAKNLGYMIQVSFQCLCLNVSRLVADQFKVVQRCILVSLNCFWIVSRSFLCIFGSFYYNLGLAYHFWLLSACLCSLSSQIKALSSHLHGGIAENGWEAIIVKPTRSSRTCWEIWPVKLVGTYSFPERQEKGSRGSNGV